MNNIESLRASFPTAVNVRRYLTRVREAIEPLGFDRSNTFTMASVCRDELAIALYDEIAGFWQRPFDLGGLAGLPAGGIETWQAGLSHIPDSHGRGKLLVFGTAHIGIAPDGTLGRVHRHGQSTTTTACGALGAVVAELNSAETGSAETGSDSTATGGAATSGNAAEASEDQSSQSEAGRLKRAILSAVGSQTSPDVQTVTTSCAKVIDDAIWESIEFLAVHGTSDVVVCTGVQIHLHDDVDHIVPIATTYKDADGKLVTLDLG